MSGSKDKLRDLDEEFVWRWICRLLIVGITLYWVHKGLDPTDRWIMLFVFLLGGNEWRARKKKDDKPREDSVEQNSGVPKQGNQSEREPPSVSFDRTIVVAQWSI